METGEYLAHGSRVYDYAVKIERKIYIYKVEPLRGCEDGGLGTAVVRTAVVESEGLALFDEDGEEEADEDVEDDEEPDLPAATGFNQFGTEFGSHAETIGKE